MTSNTPRRRRLAARWLWLMGACAIVVLGLVGYDLLTTWRHEGALDATHLRNAGISLLVLSLLGAVVALVFALLESGARRGAVGGEATPIAFHGTNLPQSPYNGYSGDAGGHHHSRQD